MSNITHFWFCFLSPKPIRQTFTTGLLKLLFDSKILWAVTAVMDPRGPGRSSGPIQRADPAGLRCAAGRVPAGVTGFQVRVLGCP